MQQRLSFFPRIGSAVLAAVLVALVGLALFAPQIQVRDALALSSIAQSTPSPSFYTLVFNPSFDEGTKDWGFWNLDRQVTNGVLEVSRQQGSADSGFFQVIPNNLPRSSKVTLRFQASNRSATLRSFTVLLRQIDWAEVRTCTFTLSPNTPMQIYNVHTRIGFGWYPMVLQVMLGEPGGMLAFDNFELKEDFLTLNNATTCFLEPMIGQELLANADFTRGLTDWGTFGSPFAQVVNGVMELARWPGSGDSGIYQFAPYGLPSFSRLNWTGTVANYSSSYKTLALVLRDPTWQHLNVCYLGLPAGSPPRPFRMEVSGGRYTWSNIVAQVYVMQDDGLPYVYLDNFSLLGYGNPSPHPAVVCPTPSQPDASGVLTQPTLQNQSITDGGTAPQDAAKP